MRFVPSNPSLGPSLREQRRARKAAKNLAMYKFAGRRPWNYVGGPEVLDGSMAVYSVFGDNPKYRVYRLKYLREPSGFKAMSLRAHAIASKLRCIERHDKALEMLGDD